MATIFCAGGCNSKLYPPSDRDPKEYAIEQGWGYLFNLFAENEKKDEYRCKGCSEKLADHIGKVLGFTTKTQTPARSTAASSKPPPKSVPKPEPPPRKFESATDTTEIGKIWRERFHAGR